MTSKFSWRASNIQGPWSVYDDHNGCCLLTENHGQDDGYNTQEIATLAAAAPDLLAALIDCDFVFTQGIMNVCPASLEAAVSNMRAAIAKASQP